MTCELRPRVGAFSRRCDACLRTRDPRQIRTFELSRSSADRAWNGRQGTPPAISLDVARGGRHRDCVTTEDDVRLICLALPGVTERLSWGRPAWFVKTLMARMWEEDVLTIKTHERDVLASAEPDTDYWARHHDRSPLLLLVRLGQVEPDELEELLRDSHRIASN